MMPTKTTKIEKIEVQTIGAMAITKLMAFSILWYMARNKQ
jgi:hypothetical protein